MIGIFDSGLGGLTLLRTLADRFRHQEFIYLGDHANVPYGDRDSEVIVSLTRQGVEALFQRGAKLVLLGCNTATAVAARRLQREWLPLSKWASLHNVLGIVAPTVEAATQTPWAVTTPQYPQKFNTDTIAVFGTTRTVASNVYPEEIGKRCPQVKVFQQVCAGLAGAIEEDAPVARINALVESGVLDLLSQTGGVAPHQAILGCTHFPLVEHSFRARLPASTRLLSQPEIVAHSLEDYLSRRPHFVAPVEDPDRPRVQLFTTGDAQDISARARIFWPEAPTIETLGAELVVS